MKRDTGGLTDRTWDLLVIGGGVFGSWIALDAALRGLRVALVEREDFASQASANSLKIIHGGFRYLKRGDLKRLRRSAREMGILLRAAPHLVSPLAVAIATGKEATQSRPAVAAALKLYRLLTVSYLKAGDAELVPPGGTISPRGYEDCFPYGDAGHLSGGAVWYDAQVYDSERFVISLLRTAGAAGASVSNYVEATGLLVRSGKVLGAEARDIHTGDTFEIRARAVANAAGGWNSRLIEAAMEPKSRLTDQYQAVGFNLVLRRPLSRMAVGVRVPSSALPDPVLGPKRFLFLAPWGEKTLLGTTYRLVRPNETPEPQEAVLEALLREVNAAAPQLEVSWDDACFFHSGQLPVKSNIERGRATALAERDRLIDHSKDGLAGLVSVIGTKYTTARSGAEMVVDRVFELLGSSPPKSPTRNITVWGGESSRPSRRRIQELFAREVDTLLEEGAAERLGRSYGTGLSELLELAREEPTLRTPLGPGSPFLQCEIAHAVRSEMARTLSDAVFRRTALASAGCPAPVELGQAAAVMARELGWDEVRMHGEILSSLEALGPFATASFLEVARAAADGMESSTMPLVPAEVPQGPDRPTASGRVTPDHHASKPCAEKPRPRILMISPHPFFALRGTPIAERELLRTLSADGYEIDVVTYPHGEDPGIPNCRIHRIPAVPGIGEPPPGFSLAKVALDPILLVWAFRMARRVKPDLVHASEEAAFIGILLRRLLGIPFVYDMDSSLPEQLLYRYRWLRPAEILLRWFEGLAIRESTGVLTVCKELEQLALRQSPDHYVRRAEDVTMLADQDVEVEDLRDITGSEDPIILYVGNLQPYQGIDILVQGFRYTLREVPQAHLVIIGGTAENVAHYTDLVAELGIDERVHLIGPRSPDQLAGYLRQASVLVSPRATGTNTPMKIYSYLDSGRPLVATRLPTHTQVLEDDHAYLVEPEPRALGDGIARVLSDPELAQRLATAARKLVQAEYTPEAHRRKVLAFYDGLATLSATERSDGPAIAPILEDE